MRVIGVCGGSHSFIYEWRFVVRWDACRSLRSRSSEFTDTRTEKTQMNQVVQALRYCTPLLVTCLVALFAIPVLAQAPYKRGDVNGDGCVNAADVGLLETSIRPPP
jgi:hypothetical protein